MMKHHKELLQFQRDMIHVARAGSKLTTSPPLHAFMHAPPIIVCELLHFRQHVCDFGPSRTLPPMECITFEELCDQAFQNQKASVAQNNILGSLLRNIFDLLQSRSVTGARFMGTCPVAPCGGRPFYGHLTRCPFILTQ